MHDFLSHAIYSNKTMTAFAVYTTQEKGSVLFEKFDEKFKVEYKGHYTVNEGRHVGAILLLLTMKKHRVAAVKNFLSQFCSVSFLMVKGVNKFLDMHGHLQFDPYTCVEENKPIFASEFTEKPKETVVNWNKIADFACKHQIDDPLIIMAHYLDFATPFPCNKCNSKNALKPHKDHEEHHKNAKLFLESRAQKTICTQAAETVMAKRRLKMLEQTRDEVLTGIFEARMQQLKDLEPYDLNLYMAGVAWYKCLFTDFEEKVFKILRLLTENVPKRRNILFKGPINSGKTSMAAALMELLGGKALNVNCPGDKLGFELGCALDKFMVVFEDVKGQVGSNKDLQPGQGFSNLDNLRDHLDGAVPVSLEKKHVNKRHQIFPPCIITANDYVIPKTVQARITYTLNFSCKENLRTSLEKNLDIRRRRVLQSGTTLLLCLIWCLELRFFKQSLQEEVKYWRTIITNEVGDDNYCRMLENVEAGDDPFNGIYASDDEEDE